MWKCYFKVFVVLLLVLFISVSCTVTQSGGIIGSVENGEHSAVTPIHRHNWWTLRHWETNERVRQGNVDLIFVGDSITQGWEGNGKEVWDEYYGERNAVNLGFSGDRTQHVLWRFDNGNIDGISPKAAVVMIGTNNSNGTDNTSEEIADGIIAICGQMRIDLPKTKILLLGIFPRGEQSNPQREKNARVNEIVSRIADGEMLFYLDFGDKFLESDKSLSSEIMPDYLHLSAKGYQIWAEAIEDKVTELMEEKHNDN
ncbi:MAG: GDSL family lipase [Planctomycetes bacterium]|nr:GDSL family lipase [Planctomycetota bacterium]